LKQAVVKGFTLIFEKLFGQRFGTLLRKLRWESKDVFVFQDCEHVSRTLEEFYTVRCQVADMRNLYDSLDEVTVKDTLDGDNMYTCSQCATKVRAEKR